MYRHTFMLHPFARQANINRRCSHRLPALRRPTHENFQHSKVGIGGDRRQTAARIPSTQSSATPARRNPNREWSWGEGFLMYCFSRIKPSHAGTSGDAGSTGRNRHACGSVLNLWNHPVKTSVFGLKPDRRCGDKFFRLMVWSWRRGLNPRPSDYKSDALPTELRQLSFQSTRVQRDYHFTAERAPDA